MTKTLHYIKVVIKFCCTTFRTYTVTCVSNSAATLYRSFIDACGSEELNVVFNATDGVKPGTLYECSVTLTADNYTSGNSPPVSQTTPLQTSGMWYGK